jgi:ADP-ribosylglycohydrolase
MDAESDRLARARLALDGLSVGDGLGAFFEMTTAAHLSPFVAERRPPKGTWRYTDDTNMALSIYAVLRAHQAIDQDALAASFAEHFDRTRGYGPGVRALVARIGQGVHWRAASESLYQGGSFGNGGAMRVAPVGTYFADDLAAVVQHARLSSEVTHSHPEGVAGAIAIAVAAAVAWQTRDRADLTATDFIAQVLPHIPPGEVRDGCAQAQKLPPGASTHDAANVLGNGSRVTAQDTVPFALWSAATHRRSYEEAIWQTLSVGGDTDTTCAIAGGIVVMAIGRDGIPTGWLNQREPLPDWALND